MTTSLVFSGGGVCFAAADTRLSFSDPSFGSIAADGPNDFTVSVTSRNFEKTIPYFMRKISPIGNSWAATAGDYLSGRKSLDLLKEFGFSDAEKATSRLSAAKSEILGEARELGFKDAASLQTRIMVASPGGTSWHCLLADLQPVEHPGPASYVVNIPPSIGGTSQAHILEKWEGEVSNSLRSRNIAQLFRASAALMHKSHLEAKCTSAQIQIGLTLSTAEGPKSGYLDGVSEEISKASDEAISRMISSALIGSLDFESRFGQKTLAR